MKEEEKAIYSLINQMQAFRKTFCDNLRKCTQCKIKPLKKAICEVIELEIKLHKEIYDEREKEVSNKN